MIRGDEDIELLLACSNPRTDKDSADKIGRLSQEKINWNWALNAASYHGVLPIVYHNLKTICPEAVPQNILSGLQRECIFNAMRNLWLTRELLHIIEKFRENGIEAVPFKGPVLAQAAYGDIILRSFSDLDIMVRKQDVLRSRDCLQSTGYKPEISMTSAQEAQYLKNNCEYNFDRQSPNIHVEIHWSFLPTHYCVPFDERIWSRLVTMPFEGTTIQSFSSEDLVLALCAHATKHKWNKIKFMSDLDGLICRNPINWDQVATSADEMHITRILHIGLILAKNLMDTKLPRKLSQKIRKDNTAQKLALDISKNLFLEPIDREMPIEDFLFWLRMQERPRNYVKYIFIMGFRPTAADYNMVPILNFLGPCYWIIRPIRLFYQYGLKKKRV